MLPSSRRRGTSTTMNRFGRRSVSAHRASDPMWGSTRSTCARKVSQGPVSASGMYEGTRGVGTARGWRTGRVSAIGGLHEVGFRDAGGRRGGARHRARVLRQPPGKAGGDRHPILSSPRTRSQPMTRRVCDVMTSGVITIGPRAPLREAARVMKDLNVGSLPVCEGERLVGVVTDRDITIRAVSSALDAMSTPVAEIMTVAPKYCFDTDPIERASALMQQLQIRRLPVIDADNKLAGIVTLGDIAVRGGR